MITTTYLPLTEAQAQTEEARVAFLRESQIGLSGAATYWYGQWSIRAAVVARIVARYCATARDMGICTVCEREGFKSYELDDSARCDECRP